MHFLLYPPLINVRGSLKGEFKKIICVFCVSSVFLLDMRKKLIQLGLKFVQSLKGILRVYHKSGLNQKLMAWCLQCPPKIKLFFLSMLFILQNKTTFQIGPMVRCSQSPRQNKTDDGRTTLVLSVGRPRTTAKILQHDPRAAIRRRFHIFYYFESLF